MGNMNVLHVLCSLQMESFKYSMHIISLTVGHKHHTLETMHEHFNM